MKQEELLKQLAEFLEDATDKVCKTIPAALGMKNDTMFRFGKAFAAEGFDLKLTVSVDVVETSGPAKLPSFDKAETGPANEPVADTDEKGLLIAQLATFGVKATKRASVETLQKKLDDAKLKAKAKGEEITDDDPLGVNDDDMFGDNMSVVDDDVFSDNAPKTPAPTVETVRDSLHAVVQAHGKPTAAAIIKKVGAAKLSEVPEDKYAELVALANKAVAAK